MKQASDVKREASANLYWCYNVHPLKTGRASHASACPYCCRWDYSKASMSEALKFKH